MQQFNICYRINPRNCIHWLIKTSKIGTSWRSFNDVRKRFARLFFSQSQSPETFNYMEPTDNHPYKTKCDYNKVMHLIASLKWSAEGYRPKTLKYLLMEILVYSPRMMMGWWEKKLGIVSEMYILIFTGYVDGMVGGRRQEELVQILTEDVQVIKIIIRKNIVEYCNGFPRTPFC